MSEIEELQALAMGLLDAHIAALAAKVPEGESAEDAIARSAARRATVAAATAAGVSALGLKDFVARVEHDMPRAASRRDPTATHADMSEFVERLRVEAPHLFGSPSVRPKGNGRAVAPDPWE